MDKSLKQNRLKHFRASPPAILAGGFIFLAVLLRFLLIRFHYPIAASDESIMDLMARHIAYNGERPIFFYGQAYMGTMEAYIGAFFILIFGSSIVAVRLGLLIFYALFLCLIYILVCRLYTRPLALFTLFLLILGNSDQFNRQLTAIGGYPEMPLLGALTLLLAYKLALTQPYTAEQKEKRTLAQRWSRIGLFAAFGLVSGFSLYIDQLSLTFVVPACVFVLFCCHKELFSLQALGFLLLFIVGLLPLILYNLPILGDPTQGTVHDILTIQSVAARQMELQHMQPINKFFGTFYLSLPSITGYAPLCPINSLPGFATDKTFSLPCTLFQGGWSTGYIALFGASLWLTISQLLFIHKKNKQQGRQADADTRPEQECARQESIRQGARIMLLGNALITVLLYVFSSSPATGPLSNSRYLFNTLISLPAILWPLWHQFSATKTFLAPVALIQKIPAFLALALVTVMLAAGTISSFQAIPDAQNVYRQQKDLTNHLLAIGATNVYSEYWTCYVTAFLSNEKISCANLTSTLHLADRTSNRYTPYVKNVKKTQDPFYVFPAKSRQSELLDAYIKKHHTPHKTYHFGDIVIYQFAKPIPIPSK